MVYIPKAKRTVWGKETDYTPQNDLEYLVMKYPNKPWCYASLARNPNITMEFIDANYKLRNKIKDYDGGVGGLSQNVNLTIDFINKYHDFFDIELPSVTHPLFLVPISWKWRYISRNTNMTKEIIEENINNYKWDYAELLHNPNVDCEFIMKHADKFDYHIRIPDAVKPELFDNRNTNVNIYDYLTRKEESYFSKYNMPDAKYIDYRDIDGDNDDPRYWDNLSSHRFGYEKTYVYYEKREEQTVKNTQVFKDELIQTIWAPENMLTCMKCCLNEDEYEELVSRVESQWN